MCDFFLFSTLPLQLPKGGGWGVGVGFHKRIGWRSEKMTLRLLKAAFGVDIYERSVVLLSNME